jgi:hypothetical protein
VLAFYFCTFGCKTSLEESEAMTPHNRNKGPLTFPVRTDHVLERIRIITRELENIQSEIYGRASTSGQPDSAGQPEDAASVRVLEQFRATLDQVRNLLWLCTEAEKTQGQLRDRHLAQAASLLRALAPAGSGPAASSPAPPSTSSSSASRREQGTQGPISFFDRLDRVIDNYVEGGGALVQPSPRQRPKT